MVLTYLHEITVARDVLLLDVMLGAKRTAPLIIAGPRDTKQCLAEIGTALVPGLEAMTPKFDLTIVEMDVAWEHAIVATTAPNVTPMTNPCHFT